MEKIDVPVDDNSPSIEHILRPISFTSWLLGVGVARPQKCSKAVTIIIRIVHLAVCSVSMVYHVIDYISYYFSIYDPDDHVYTIIYCIDRVMCFVSAYYYVYHGIGQYDKWPELMNKIKELDQKIRRETHINNQPVKNAAVVALLTTFVCYLLFLNLHIFYYFMYTQDIYVTDFLFDYTLIQSLINSFIFDVVVYVLYYRFQTINKVINQLDVMANPPWIALKIRRIREWHTSICDLVMLANDIHGVHLLFCSVNSFTMVVAALFRIYSAVLTREDKYYEILIDNIIWILGTIQFGLMCWICTLARQESDKTGIIMCAILLKYKSMNQDKLHETGNLLNVEMRSPSENQDSEQNFNCSGGHNLNYIENFLRKNLEKDCVRNEINDFLIQLQHHRVAFMACNFFEMSNILFSGVST
ncbi:uncharacterized protein LOC105829265 isoform X1 [Monomorium pharaonis]|uniref:uncharacterized protein LOC105829265 isoform X1 n=1 Tax=Monomorium pharaonis TaxID=307658 RepID=UPI00102E12E1|nr:uncharacterized protein LOC105829265 isoform X1 [Monomorium pharaonis]